ncbi:MAG: hypothetical protein Fur0032_16710 [Terrimicrobiaceae bacterium]
MASCCTFSESDGARPQEWARLALAGLVAAQSMVFGLAINLAPPDGTARVVLHAALGGSAVVVFALCGGPLLSRSWQALRSGRIVFDQLFLAGIFAAFGASLHCSLTGTGHVYYELVAVLLAIWTFGGILTENQRRKALDAAGNLGREFAECDVETPAGLYRKPTCEVEPGDTILVSAGGAICVDGRVASGSAFVQESALTGEPFPVVREAGDLVRAGSYVVDSPLRIIASGPFRELDRLLASLEEARLQPSRLQRSADRLASWFLPVVLIIAALTLAGWTWADGWQTGLFHALSVILVACPCAMGIATPVALWSALGEFARRGLMAHHGDLVEKLAQVDHVIFDKTGTLAAEHLDMVEFTASSPHHRTDLLQLAAALEAASQHPIALAFARVSSSGLRAENVQTLPGAGLMGIVDGKEIRIGNSRILPPDAETSELAVGGKPNAERLSTEDGTHRIYMVMDGKAVGVATLRERLRAGAREGIAALHEMGITTEVMTGDQRESASIHGLPGLIAGLSPGEKASLVEQRRREGRHVLFVGDGINDSAAMLAADAAIAIRSGAPLARDVADGEIPGANLQSLAEILLAARSSLGTLRSNLLFAAGYNALGVGLAASGLLHPVAAALLMLVSSLIVTGRALRGARPIKTRQKSSVPPVTIAPSLVPPYLILFAGVAIFLQGIVLVRATWLSGPPAAGLVILFASGGIILMLASLRYPPSPTGLATLMMFSVGGLAMLIGWWADAGFGPLFPDSSRNCGLAGLLDGWNWMQPAMVAAALPSLALEPRRGTARLACWGAGVAGMLVGMEAASWLAGWVPDRPPAFHILAAYAAMIFGMAIGMALACNAARRLIR